MKPTQEEIGQRAYLIYLEHGRQDGRALDDWLAAESELIHEAAEKQEQASPGWGGPLFVSKS